MKAYDMIQKTEVEVTRKELIDLMRNNRQVDLIFAEKHTDADGYLTWDAENWTGVDGKRFIRSYSLEGRVLRDFTAHNIHDLEAYFFPDQAKQVQIN